MRAVVLALALAFVCKLDSESLKVGYFYIAIRNNCTDFKYLNLSTENYFILCNIIEN